MTTSTPKISELAVIDSRVENYSTLAASIKPGTEVIVLNSETDGIEQIAAALKNHTDIKAVHIISHGEPGSLLLGSTKLNSDNLDSYQASLKQWFSPSPIDSNDSTTRILNADTRMVDATATHSLGVQKPGFFTTKLRCNPQIQQKTRFLRWECINPIQIPHPKFSCTVVMLLKEIKAIISSQN